MRLFHEARPRLYRLLSDKRLVQALSRVMSEGGDRVVVAIKPGGSSAAPSAMPGYIKAAKAARVTDALLAGLHESARDKRALLSLLKGNALEMTEERVKQRDALEKELVVLESPLWAIIVFEEPWSCLTETGKDAAMATALACCGVTHPDDDDDDKDAKPLPPGVKLPPKREPKPPKPWIAKYPYQSVPAVELVFGTAWWEQHYLASSGDAAAANGEPPALSTLRDLYANAERLRARLSSGPCPKGKAMQEAAETIETLHRNLAEQIAKFDVPKVRPA